MTGRPAAGSAGPEEATQPPGVRDGGGAPDAAELAGAPLLLGVRHHGPGSARAVRAALEARRPRVLLVEGPPEADGVVALAADEAMRPPVALLAHAVDEPGRAVFWPLAGFSPEWVAVRWALERGVPVRFIDLPAAHVLALGDEAGYGPASGDDGGTAHDGDEGGAGNDGDEGGDERGGGRGGERGREPGGGQAAGDGQGEGSGDDGPEPEEAVRADPLAVLAEAAGYDDAEAWWEDVVEHRGAGSDPYAPFAVLAEAMAALREGRHGTASGPSGPAPGGPPDERGGPDGREGPGDRFRPDSDLGPHHRERAGDDGAGDDRDRARDHRERAGDLRDRLREAHMRLRLRDAVREFGASGVAVVCGAWHVPALAAKTKVADDRRLLKGLPKSKAEITWVPWTYRRLARRSGYGAGVTSPGWYQHLFDSPDRAVERWMTKVARLLREEDHGVSSADVIEAVRLADSLAAVRGRPVPGLAETVDAVRAVMCGGSDVPMALIWDRLVVGNELGQVPEEAPAVPLQRDLARQQRRLRLKPEVRERELDLDLRKETDAARSRLLHRLRLLGVDWGLPARPRTGGTGTFRESWRLRWEPELLVRTAEAGVWGTTVEAAATAKAMSLAAEAAALAEVTAVAERCLLAELPGALGVVMRALADRAALDADVGRLAEALPALARSVRYGTVRGTGPAAMAEVAGGIAERVCVGLPPACSGLDADGAERMRGHIDAVHRSMALLSQAEMHAQAEMPARLEATAQRRPEPQVPAQPQVPRPAPRPEPRQAQQQAEGQTEGQTEQPARAHVPEGAPGQERAERGRPAAAGEKVPGTGTVGARLGVQSRWRAALRKLASGERVPGLVRGRCVRLLLDEGQLAQPEAARLMSRALSPGTPPPQAAAWIEGFLAGDGMLLVHDERLLSIVDGWLTSVPDGAFTDVLPLLRRTFAGFEPGARRTLGELVRRGGPPVATALGTPGERPGAYGPPLGLRPVRAGFGPGLDEARAAAVLPALRLLLPEGASPQSREAGPPTRGAGQAGDERVRAGSERGRATDVLCRAADVRPRTGPAGRPVREVGTPEEEAPE